MAILEKTEINFDESVSTGFCVVDFYGEFCGPCKLLSAAIQRVEAEMPFVTFIKVNTTRCSALAERFQVEAVPTLLIMKDGKVLYRHLGYLGEDQLSELIGTYLYG